jgi:hypothetical protein
VLRAAGVVEARREGSWVYYRLADQLDEVRRAQLKALVGSFSKREVLRQDVERLVRFANPAVTLARAATHTFAGIRPADAPAFLLAQLVGAALATALFRWLSPSVPAVAPELVVPHSSNGPTPRDGGNP